MPKGPQGQKRPADIVGCAVHVAKIATGEIEESGYKQPNKVRSGKAGGKARASALDLGKRREISRVAAGARWKKDDS